MMTADAWSAFSLSPGSYSYYLLPTTCYLLPTTYIYPAGATIVRGRRSSARTIKR